jgi:hypothetical protein
MLSNCQYRKIGPKLNPQRGASNFRRNLKFTCVVLLYLSLVTSDNFASHLVLCVPLITQQLPAGPAYGWSTEIWICCGIGGTYSICMVGNPRLLVTNQIVR